MRISDNSGFLFRSGNERRLFATAVLVYFLFQRAGGAGSRYLTLVYSIVRDGTFQIDKYLYIHNIDISFYKGHFYLAAQPGASFLAAPFYALIRLPLSLFHLSQDSELIIANLSLNFIINILPAAYCGVLFFRIAKRFTSSEGESTAATIAFYFGTMIFSYATEFMVGDSLAMVFCGVAFYHLFTFRESPSITKAVFTGCSISAAIFIGKVSIPPAVLLAIYSLFIMKPKHIIAACISGTVMLAPLFVYNKICFDSIFSSYDHFMYQEDFSNYYQTGQTDFPKISRMINLTVMPIRGYFLYMPITLLCIPAVIMHACSKLSRKSRFHMHLESNNVGSLVFYLLVSIFSVQLILNAGIKTWSAGASWGPRYMLVSIPFMMLLAASFFRYVKPAFVWVLIGISIIINTVGSMGVPFCRDLFGYFAGFFTLGWRPRLPAAHLFVDATGLFPRHLITGRVVFLVSCIFGLVACAVIYYIWKPGPESRKSE